jgi:hypothetical protein
MSLYSKTNNHGEPMPRPRLQHPTRAVLLHVPISLLAELDRTAQERFICRSELMRELLRQPVTQGSASLKPSIPKSSM